MAPPYTCYTFKIPFPLSIVHEICHLLYTENEKWKFLQYTLYEWHRQSNSGKYDLQSIGSISYKRHKKLFCVGVFDSVGNCTNTLFSLLHYNVNLPTCESYLKSFCRMCLIRTLLGKSGWVLMYCDSPFFTTSAPWPSSALHPLNQ